MAISYRKLISMLDEYGITSYTMKKDGIVGQSAWKKIHEGGNIDMRTVDALCRYLGCQPGDMLEYVETEIDVDKSFEDYLKKEEKQP